MLQGNMCGASSSLNSTYPYNVENQLTQPYPISAFEVNSVVSEYKGSFHRSLKRANICHIRS